MIQCPTCGATHAPDAARCVVCGTPWQAPAPQGYPPPQVYPAAVSQPPPPAGTPAAQAEVPPGAPAVASRVAFHGPGGGLFLTCLFSGVLPGLAVVVLGLLAANGLLAVANGDPWGDYAALAVIPVAVLSLAVVAVRLAHGIQVFYWPDVTLDGARCAYTGTALGMAGAMAGHAVLLVVTLGLYGPWFLARYHRWVAAHVTVEGGSLVCEPRGGALFLPWVLAGLGMALAGAIPVLGQLALLCGALWLHGRVAAWRWKHSTVNGRPTDFDLATGDLLGTHLGPTVMGLCSAGIYAPWAVCRLWDWEARHVR